MQKPKWLRKLASVIAPEACPFCDGGSGTTRDERTGTIRRCEKCEGTGLARVDGTELQRRIDARFRGWGRGRPKSAA